MRLSPINTLPIITTNNNNIKYKQNITFLPIFDNRAELLQSCSINFYYDFLKPSYRQPYLTRKICYTHVHKCGGTSIMNLFKYLHSNHYIDSLYRPKDVEEWAFDLHSQRNHEDIILFTYIRDPIDRFISGFYEMKRRNGEIGDRNEDGGNKTEDLMEIRSLLENMMELKNENKFVWMIDKHLWPQLLFLIDKYGNVLDFNYIGLSENINVTLPRILHQYENVDVDIVKDYLGTTIHHNSRSRMYDEEYAAYKHYVGSTDLSQIDKQIIRELYWLDYQCLFPEQDLKI